MRSIKKRAKTLQKQMQFKRVSSRQRISPIAGSSKLRMTVNLFPLALSIKHSILFSLQVFSAHVHVAASSSRYEIHQKERGYNKNWLSWYFLAEYVCP